MIGVRKALPNDLHTIMEIVRKVVPLLNREGNYQWNESYPTENDFRHDIENGFLYVAVHHAADKDPSLGGEVVGFIAITANQPPEYHDLDWKNTDADVLVPHRLGVNPDYHRQGIAQLLMQHVETIARNKGVKTIRVDTNIANDRMNHIIRKLGYEYIGNVFFVKGKHGRLEFRCYQKVLS
jgi:ribosomal protein S18 acetylase RimI-like enzyme